MKIISVDNYARETRPDIIIAETTNARWANVITMLLNEKYSGVHSSFYARAVADDYKLYDPVEAGVYR